jgi:hypothetical protein
MTEEEKGNFKKDWIEATRNGKYYSIWQSCPHCGGSGFDRDGSYASAVCIVCNGKKIISTLTGLPPL